MPKQDEKSVKAGAEAPKSPHALFFELDYAADNSRKILFEKVRERVRSHKGDLTMIQFQRFWPGSFTTVCPADLAETCGMKKITPEKWTEEVSDMLKEEFPKAGASMGKGLSRLLQASLECGLAIGALSTFPKEAAEALFEKFGLAKRGAKLFVFPPEPGKGFPRADLWIKTVHSLSLQPRACVAVVTSMPACKSALAADLRCVAIPDEFTLFQDFGGAHVMVEDSSHVDSTEVFDRLFLPATP